MSARLKALQEQYLQSLGNKPIEVSIGIGKCQSYSGTVYIYVRSHFIACYSRPPFNIIKYTPPMVEICKMKHGNINWCWCK
jgi:hypothetical protein